MTRASLVAVARRLKFIRETRGANRGAWVEWLQRFTGGSPGDPWCADLVSVVLDIAYFGRSPLEATGSTVLLLKVATAKGWRVETPEVEDLYFFLRADLVTPHHVGIVTSVDPLKGIAGNTSPDGLSDNGTGVFEHAIPEGARTAFVRLP